MPIVFVTAVIPAGASLSSAINASDGKVLRVTTPTAWTPAKLSFQVSNDGTTFTNAVSFRGKEILVPCKANRTVLAQTAEEHAAALQFVHVKFRSGPSHAPVPQAAARTFTVAIEK